jgi:hypothetical protein
MRIVTVSNNDDVLQKNLLQSDIFKHHVLTVGYTTSNIPQAINEMNYPTLGARMFVHNDVYIPRGFEERIIKTLYDLPDDWGVIGAAGASMIKGERHYLGHIEDRGRKWGRPVDKPVPVQTLDELLIIVNDNHGFWKFDEQFPFDFYGADICMQAHERGLGVYVVPAFVHHNSSRKIGERTPSFYESEAKFKEKWKHRLPIATTCSILR